MTFRGGHVVALAAAIVAVLACGETARSSVEALPLLEQVNGVRRQLGLVPLRADPVVRRVVERMARHDSSDRTPEVLDAQPDCVVCHLYFEGGLARDPRVHYHSLGGRALIGFALWRARWTATQNLSVFFPAAALVLDPRARTFAAARTPLGMLVVGVTGERRARFDRPVRWPRGSLDPRQQLWVEVMLPPGEGFPHLYDVRDGRDVTVAYPLAMARGLGGSRLVAFGLNSSLAYGRVYHVGATRLGVRMRTRDTPSALLRRGWTFRSVTSSDRQDFLSVVARTPPLLRRLLAGLDGAVEVVGGSQGCLIADACERGEGDRATIGIASGADPFVVLHELGHVVFDLAFDEHGRRTFRAALVRAGWEGACCFNVSEGFADQLAFWALGGVPAGVRSYSDRLYLAPAELAAFLRAHASYRPLSARGLLAR